MLEKTLIIIVALASTSALNVPSLDGRIYGGFETTVERFPHQVQLRRGTSHHCGAAIVAPNVVITAAHCIDGLSAESLRINAGVTNRQEEGTIVQVRSVHRHPDFEWQNFQNDIAVLLLESSIQFTDKIQPAQLPSRNEAVAPNAIAFASGWGITESGKGVDILRAVEVNVFSREHCAEIFSAKRYTEKNLCAGNEVTPRDTCGGDSGGPLFSNGKLIGVVSWGYGCGNPEFPGVYANVANLREWIDSIVAV